jgi:hypothetical protein
VPTFYADIEPYVRTGEDGVPNSEEKETFVPNQRAGNQYPRERGLSEFSFHDDGRMNAMGNSTAKNTRR